jgi:tRNA1(Val) A37 N6-methylase TrmN6
MYGIKNVLDKNPIDIMTALVLIVNFVVLMGWWELSGEQTAALNGAGIAVLGLFVKAKTTNTAKLEELDPQPPAG